jgi:Putative adhesin
MQNLLKTLAVALLLTGPAIAQNNNETPYFTKTFATNGLTTVRVETSGGSIAVEGDHAGEAKVEVYVQANGWNGSKDLSKAELDERLSNYLISVETQGNTLVATAKRKSDKMNWKNGLSIAFRVYVPRQMTTDLHTSGGSIRLSHLAGKQHFETSGGSLNLTDLDGNTEGRTSGGSINLNNCRPMVDVETSGGSIEAVASSGKIKLETSGGSIRLRDLDGNVHANTSGGSVEGNDIKGELEATTSGGSVRIKGMAGSLEASTSSGSIEAEMVSVGKYVRLSTSSGSVRVKMPLDKGLDLDLRGNRVNVPQPLSNFNGSIEKDRVRGQLNGGGIPVVLSASSGSVSVSN